MSNSTQKACEHPPASRFWDSDEERCRSCNGSLSFPPRSPTRDDAKELKLESLSFRGDKRRAYTPVEAVEVEVEKAVEVEVEVQLLPCTCCKLMLPTDSFYTRNNPKAAKRLFRTSRCKGCTAFALRVKRQQNPELRERAKLRQARYQAALTPEKRERERQRRDTSANPSAVKRYQARKAGIPVMVQKAGRLPIHIKPACRVAETCPLREYCTVEGKGLA